MKRIMLLILCFALIISCSSCASQLIDNPNLSQSESKNDDIAKGTNSITAEQFDNKSPNIKENDAKDGTKPKSVDDKSNMHTSKENSLNDSTIQPNDTNSSKDNSNVSNSSASNSTENKSEEQKSKVWVVDTPEQIIMNAPIEYDSPDKSIFTQSYCDSNNIIHLRTVDGELELWQVTEETELLIGVDVIMGDVGRVTLMSGETIWLWGGYTAAYHYAETLDNYASFGNNGIMPGNYDCVDMVQKWTPVTVIPEKGHWEWK